MGRLVQPKGERGSLKWMQLAVGQRPPRVLDSLILPRLGGATRITWQSPLEEDGFAEYRDEAFLEKIGASALAPALAQFWPRRGPQWDGLATTDRDDVLLVEAKAHIAELCSPPSQASGSSLKSIEAALGETAASLGADMRVPWTDLFYQLTNRLAHLHFLRDRGAKAWLVLVNFVGDGEMGGPTSQAEWVTAYQIVWHVLGIPNRHKLAPFVLHVCADVKSLQP
jgi:hypothetical protein